MLKYTKCRLHAEWFAVTGIVNGWPAYCMICNHPAALMHWTASS